MRLQSLVDAAHPAAAAAGEDQSRDVGKGDVHELEPILAFEVPRAVSLIAGAPRLTAATCGLLREIHVLDEAGRRRSLHVPIERALTIIVDGHERVTLMTLGGAPELLVLGFLLNQRVIDDVRTVASVAVDWEAGSAIVMTHTAPGQVPNVTRPVATACGNGSVYDSLKLRIEAIRLPPAAHARIDRATLLAMLETMRRYDAIHRHAGSVHSCALFQGADLQVAVEDVSRHNGMDTVTGWMALHGISGDDKTLFSTGRLTAEMVMKAALAGVPLLVSRNGVSSLGLELAGRLGMSLFGRAANKRFLCFTGDDRFDADAELPP